MHFHDLRVSSMSNDAEKRQRSENILHQRAILDFKVCIGEFRGAQNGYSFLGDFALYVNETKQGNGKWLYLYNFSY